MNESKQRPITQYEEAKEYLTARLDFEGQPSARPYSSTHYSLDRFVRLLERLGNPQNRVPSVHIAGSKGKGSVAILLESALIQAGFHVGTYTSPHLRDYPERFRIDGQAISKEEFTQTLVAIAPAVESDGYENGDSTPYRTVFELLTAMAFDLFAHRELDIVVLETGLGGRLDCTNVVRPEVAVITPLGLDHTALLGPTLDRIAFEKGGIIKEGIPVVIASQSPAARVEGLPVLLDLATQRHAPVVLADELFDVVGLSQREDSQKAVLKGLRRPNGQGSHALRLDLPEFLEATIPLVGSHQLDNLRTAAAVWTVLRREGWELSWEAFSLGVEKARWPGRMDIVQSRPRVVVDGAHCPLSARALARALDDLYPGTARHVILGAQRDKDVGAIVRGLTENAEGNRGAAARLGAAGRAGSAGETGQEAIEPAMGNQEQGADASKRPDPSNILSWGFYTVPGGRGATGGELAERAIAAGVSPDTITVHGTASEALDAAFERAAPQDIVVSCGTLYTIAEILDRARAKIPQSCP